MSILWTIIIGFIVGVVAKFLMPGDKSEPKGFILTAILGIVGAFVATYLGQSVGWYGAGEFCGVLWRGGRRGDRTLRLWPYRRSHRARLTLPDFSRLMRSALELPGASAKGSKLYPMNAPPVQQRDLEFNPR